MAVDNTGALFSSLANYGNDVVLQAVNFVVALIIVFVFLVIGYFVAKLINNIVLKALANLKLENWLQQRNLQNALGGFSLTRVISVLLEVYIVFAFLGAATQVVQSPFLTSIIQGFLVYMPSLAQGLVVIIATLYVAAFISNTIKSKKEIFMSHQLALGVQLFVGYLAIVMALPLLLPGLGPHIQILESLLVLFIQAVILAFGLAVGLSFGLGLKDPINKAASKNQDIFDSLFTRFKKK